MGAFDREGRHTKMSKQGGEERRTEEGNIRYMRMKKQGEKNTRTNSGGNTRTRRRIAARRSEGEEGRRKRGKRHIENGDCIESFPWSLSVGEWREESRRHACIASRE